MLDIAYELKNVMQKNFSVRYLSYLYKWIGKFDEAYDKGF